MNPYRLAANDAGFCSSCREWHLARARTAPSKLVALNEIRASLRTPGADDDEVEQTPLS
jgi:hypothetical protein